MSSQVFPKKNAAFTFYISLTSQAAPNTFQANPTLAAGDVKVSIDGGALANLTTLPSASPASSKIVVVALSSDEMNGDNIQVIFSDAAGAEWADAMVNIQTTARQVDDLAFPATSGRSLLVAASGSVPSTSLETQAKADVNAEVVDVMTVDVLADSVSADGSRPTIGQAVYALIQFLSERAISGTTMTVKKVDGTTALMTFTLNDATNPTSITRAT